MRPQRMTVHLDVDGEDVSVDADLTDYPDGADVEVHAVRRGGRRWSERELWMAGVSDDAVSDACRSQLARERRAAVEAQDDARREGL